MNDLFTLFLQIVLIFCFLIITRYVIPFIREKIGSEKFDRVVSEVETLVLAAQQMYSNLSGPERRAIVTQKLNDFLIAKKIALNDQQIRDLIEAAVKSMKIDEGSAAS